jgi:hypothetical protein
MHALCNRTCGESIQTTFACFCVHSAYVCNIRIGLLSFVVSSLCFFFCGMPTYTKWFVQRCPLGPCNAVKHRSWRSYSGEEQCRANLLHHLKASSNHQDRCQQPFGDLQPMMRAIASREPCGITIAPLASQMRTTAFSQRFATDSMLRNRFVVCLCACVLQF